MDLVVLVSFDPKRAALIISGGAVIGNYYLKPNIKRRRALRHEDAGLSWPGADRECPSRKN